MLARSAKKWLRRIVIVAMIGGGIGYWAFGREQQVTYVTEEAALRDVREIIDVTGSVEASEAIELRFPTSGTITTIDAKVGETVKAGAVLASLDTTLAAIEVQKAQASVAAAQAELGLLFAGPADTEAALYKTDIDDAELALANAAQNLIDTKSTNEHKLEKAEQELVNAETAVANAEIALENVKKSGGTSGEIADKALTDVFINAENDIRAALDSIEQTVAVADRILDDESSEGRAHQVYLGFKDPQTKISAKNSLKREESLLSDLRADFAIAREEWTAESIADILQDTDGALLNAKDLTDTVFAMLEASTDSASLTEAEITAFQSEIKAERSSILTQIDSLRTTEQTILDAGLGIASTDISTTTGIDAAEATLSDARNRLLLAERVVDEIKTQNAIALSTAKKDIEQKKLQVRRREEQFAKLVAKPRPVDTAAAQARLQQASATLLQAQKQFDDLTLTAPVEGVVTAINGEIGEHQSAGETMIALMTDTLQITANVSETDVAKIAIGDPVDITLDALPSDVVFDGTVTEIEPAETVIQGVIYYQTTVVFGSDDERIKSGMTADLEILVAEALDTISVTPGAIQYEDDTPFVYVLENGEKVRRDITLGLEGNDAVQILSGVESGDRIVLYEEEE